MKKKKEKSATKVIIIKYEVDTSPIERAIKKANELRKILRGIHFA